jgi:hypothetical protein
MSGLRNDIPDIQPIIVTKKGYQSGAVMLARSEKISLQIITDDFEDRIQGIQMELTATSPSVKPNFKIRFDENWIQENLTLKEIEISKRSYSGSSDDLYILDHKSGVKNSFLDLISSNPFIDKDGECILDFENASLEQSGFPNIKIISISRTYETDQLVINSDINLTAKTLIENVLENRLFFIDDAGIITENTKH